MNRSLSLLAAAVLGASLLGACASDDVEPAADVDVASGLPLELIDPTLATASDGTTIVVGTLSNVTERTVEIISATSETGDVEFRSSSDAASIVVEPGSTFSLEENGMHLTLLGADESTESAEVTLELDIQDQLTFTAVREADTAGDALAETRPAEVVGEPLAPMSDVDTALGATAPTVVGSSFDGTAVSLPVVGTPTVIGFFAHWCPHCQEEVDELTAHFEANGLPDDVAIMAVSTAVDSAGDNYPPSAWFDTEGWPTPILADDSASSTADAFGLTGFPFWVVVDADGTVMERVGGGLGPDEFDALVERARTGGVT